MTGYFGPLEADTEANNSFRKVIFTGKHMQLVLMCLQGGEEIGNEIHGDVDQFFRIEQGHARFILNNQEQHEIGPGDAAIVPAGTWHNVVNASATEKLQLYTIYTPPQHPDGTVHRTKQAADAAEAAEHH